MKHNHDSFEHSCPACGLAPKQRQPIVQAGFEFLTQNLAPCACGGGPVLIEGGSPKRWRYYCQNAHSKLNNGRPCEVTTKEYDNHPESVLAWNNIQIAKGFDARKLHPLNRIDTREADDLEACEKANLEGTR